MALQLNYLRAQRCVSSPFLVPRAPARLPCCHLVKASAQAEPTIAVTFIAGEDQQPIELQCPSGEQLRAFMLDSKVGACWLHAAQQPPACSKPLTLLQLHGMKEMQLLKYHIGDYELRTLVAFYAPHHSLCAARYCTADLYTTWGKIWQCGGAGQCGTCIVNVQQDDGLLSERTVTEQKKLGGVRSASWRSAGRHWPISSPMSPPHTHTQACFSSEHSCFHAIDWNLNY